MSIPTPPNAPSGRRGEGDRHDHGDEDRQHQRDELAKDQAEQQQPGGEKDRPVGDV
jgi:hypothetical protein